MTQHDPHDRLQHVLDAASEAMALVDGKTRADLDRERILELAVVRLLEVVGEAAARVDPATRQAHPEVPWPAIVGLHQRLLRGYDEVDLDVVWHVVAHDLPTLVAQLRAALG